MAVGWLSDLDEIEASYPKPYRRLDAAISVVGFRKI
jgi:hypothetical protein